MLMYAVISFAVAAVLGLIMAASIFRGALASWALSLVHAALGATGLVLVLLAVFNGSGGLIPVGVVVLLIAALGGFYLAYLHLQNKVAPSGVVLVHAGVAVAGFLILSGTVFGIL